ncbi:hypothetical protein FOZ61_002933 [Perkinsus olseni]|uniref:Uncharacterized protein n=1 Tax=Perkinsus olseni TaxID=32597 RepID=A0A7J6LS16_PEROL|nr:hypothetical protein FOZ61_002933 [Perkinsus olseni]
MSWSSNKYFRAPNKSIDEQIRIGAETPSPQQYDVRGKKQMGDAVPGGKISESRLERSSTVSEVLREKSPGPGDYQNAMTSSMPLLNGGKFVAPRYSVSSETKRLLREDGGGGEAMGPVSTLGKRSVSFSQSRRVPEFVDGPAIAAAEIPAPNEYDAVNAHTKLTEKGQYPTLKQGLERPLPGKNSSIFEEIADTKRMVPGPGAYSPRRPPQRQSQSRPVLKLEGETSAASRRLFLAKEVPGPGAYDIPEAPRSPVIAVMKPGEARLPYSMPGPFDYNCQPDVGQKFTQSESKEVCRKLLRVSSSSSKLIDMLTNAPIASRVAVADQIYGRSRRQKSQPAKGFLDRKSSMEDCNVELDVIPDGDFVTFGAAGGGHSVDDRSAEPELSPPTAVGLEWRFGEDFGQDDMPYDTIEEPPMADAIAGEVPYDERLGLSHDVYSTKLAGHLHHQAKPRGLFLPEASVDRRIVSVGSPTDDDWFDCHHERVSMAAKLLDEATQSLLDPLDTGVLLNRAEASLINKATSKSKLLGMCSHRRRALLRELPPTIAQRRSKLSSKGPVV